MTSEKATYYRLMLLAGLREEFDQNLELTLETADPIPDPELDLAFCMSDLDKTISVLYNYALRFSVDEAQVCQMVLTELRRLYTEKYLSAVQLVGIMETMAQNCENSYEEPWDQLRYPAYDYELVEDGLVSQEVFERAFDAYFLHQEQNQKILYPLLIPLVSDGHWLFGQWLPLHRCFQQSHAPPKLVQQPPRLR